MTLKKEYKIIPLKFVLWPCSKGALLMGKIPKASYVILLLNFY